MDAVTGAFCLDAVADGLANDVVMLNAAVVVLDVIAGLQRLGQNALTARARFGAQQDDVAL